MGTVPQWLQDIRAIEGGGTGHAGYFEDVAPHDGVGPHFMFLSRNKLDDSVNNLTRDVAFNRHSMNDGHHHSPLDNNMIQVGTDGLQVRLVQGIDEDNFKRVLSAATRATVGLPVEPYWEECSELRGAIHEDLGAEGDFGEWIKDAEIETPDAPCGSTKHRVTGTRAEFSAEHLVDPLEPEQDWEEMLRGGLQQALESQSVVFAVSGASRCATHQIVRTRDASFHQQSQRPSYMGDHPEFRMPESVWRNVKAREAFLKAVSAAHEAYRVACEEDIAYQDARFILPEGTTNYIQMTYTVRSLMNVYAYRGCSMFMWEHVAIMRKCREVLLEKHPWLAPSIKISCQTEMCDNCHGSGITTYNFGDSTEKCRVCKGSGMTGRKCTFQGWENVEGQCDFSWAKQGLRTFQPKFHAIAKGADK